MIHPPYTFMQYMTAIKVLFLSLSGTCYFTDGFADLATSHDPKPFPLTLKAKFDPRSGISVANLP